MSITHLTAKAVAIPLKRKTRMSTRALTERQFLLVWLSDDDGVTGMGYSYAGTVGGQLLADAVRDVLSGGRARVGRRRHPRAVAPDVSGEHP